MMILEPIFTKQSYSNLIEKQVKRFFNEEIFKKIILAVQQTKKIVFNSNEALRKAILAGRVRYINGMFTGSFNASVSRELKRIGARYSSRYNAYLIQESLLSVELLSVIAKASINFQDLGNSALSVIDNLQYDDALESVEFDVYYSSILQDGEKQFISSTKRASDVITISQQFSVQEWAAVAKKYSNNMKLYVRDFTKSMIQDLRAKVEKNVLAGLRPDALENLIVEKYNTSQKKAAFLARQETSLLMSKFREVRYQSVGLDSYQWSTSDDSRVRDDHDDLDGRVFKWGHPPVVDKGTGKRARPGEDFGCRCIAKPIVN